MANQMHQSQVDRQWSIDRIFNPHVQLIGLYEVAAILGLAKSTAHKSVDKSDELCLKLPVDQIEYRHRYVVSTLQLRANYDADLPMVGASHGGRFIA